MLKILQNLIKSYQIIQVTLFHFISFILIFFSFFFQLTHFVMVKELKHCRSIEELSCSETVKHKAKDYVRKYMAKQGPLYKPESNEEKEKLSPKEVSQDFGIDHNTVDTLTNDQ